MSGIPEEIYTSKDGKVYEGGREMSVDWIASALNMYNHLIHEQKTWSEEKRDSINALQDLIGRMIDKIPKDEG